VGGSASGLDARRDLALECADCCETAFVSAPFLQSIIFTEPEEPDEASGADGEDADASGEFSKDDFPAWYHDNLDEEPGEDDGDGPIEADEEESGYRDCPLVS